MKKLFVGFLISTVTASAGTIISYTTLASWSSTVTGATLTDFEGVYGAGTGAFQPGGQVTVGLINIQTVNASGRLYWSGPGVYAVSSILTTQPRQPVQFDRFVVTPSAAKTAIAFDLGNFRFNEHVDIQFHFVDSTSQTLNVLTPALNASTNLRFFGFTGDTAIDQVTIARTAVISDAFSYGLGIDNIRLGDATATPEPASALLAASALVALGSLRRWRQTRSC